MRARKSHTVGVLVGAALVLAAACSAQGQAASPAQRPAVDRDVLRAGASYDYEVEPSATEVAETAEVVVSGTVVSWSDGRAIDEGSVLRSRSAVLAIDVDEAAGDLPALAPTTSSPSVPPATIEPRSRVPPQTSPSSEGTGPSPSVPRTPLPEPTASPDPASTPGSSASADGPKTVFVEFFRGDVDIDENGNDVVLPTNTMLSIDDLQAATPVGARVLFIGGPASADDDVKSWGGLVTQSWQPPFEGAELLSPMPQGLLFEDADGTYVSAVADQMDVQGRGWPDRPGERSSGDEFEQLLEQVF